LGVFPSVAFQRTRIAALLIAAAAHFLTLPAPAQGSLMATNLATNSLSLTEAKNTAFARNWDLLAAQSGVDSATAQLIVTKEFPNPSASLYSAKIGERTASTPLGNNLWERNYDSIAAVSQLIEIGGKRHDRQAAARASLLSAKARFYDAKRTLDQGVTKAYIAALLAGETARNLSESARYMRHEATIAEAQRAAGDLSDADTKTIEINAEQFELQAKTAEATAVQARIAVEVLMGVDEPKGNWIPEDRLEKLVTTSAPAEESDTNTNAERPDVLAAETDVRAAESNLKLRQHFQYRRLFSAANLEPERRQYQGRAGGLGPVPDCAGPAQGPGRRRPGQCGNGL